MDSPISSKLKSKHLNNFHLMRTPSDTGRLLNRVGVSGGADILPLEEAAPPKGSHGGESIRLAVSVVGDRDLTGVAATDAPVGSWGTRGVLGMNWRVSASGAGVYSPSATAGEMSDP